MHNTISTVIDPIVHPRATARRVARAAAWTADVALFLVDGFTCSPDSGHDPVGDAHDITCSRCRKHVALDADGTVRWVK